MRDAFDAGSALTRACAERIPDRTCARYSGLVRTFLVLSLAPSSSSSYDDFGSGGRRVLRTRGPSRWTRPPTRATPARSAPRRGRHCHRRSRPHRQAVRRPVLLTGIPSQALYFTLAPDEKQAFFNATARSSRLPFDGRSSARRPLSVAKSTERVSCVTFNATGAMLFVEDFFRVFRQTRFPMVATGVEEIRPPVSSSAAISRRRSSISRRRALRRSRPDRRPLDAPFGIARAADQSSNGDVGPFTSVEVGDPDAQPRPQRRRARALLSSSRIAAPLKPDIWVARRASPNDAFSGRSTMRSAASRRRAPHLSRDGCRLSRVSARRAGNYARSSSRPVSLEAGHGPGTLARREDHLRHGRRFGHRARDRAPFIRRGFCRWAVTTSTSTARARWREWRSRTPATDASTSRNEERGRPPSPTKAPMGRMDVLLQLRRYPPDGPLRSDFPPAGAGSSSEVNVMGVVLGVQQLPASPSRTKTRRS